MKKFVLRNETYEIILLYNSSCIESAQHWTKKKISLKFLKLLLICVPLVAFEGSAME